ncbi:MAG TPA: hypothetical protein VFA64_07090 [Hyphomicrobiaceae bacterium]|nr:hypothetical protein [Hyphomicrobiaceae bacterium]
MKAFGNLAPALACASLLLASGPSQTSAAQPAGLDGTWSGGGVVSFASGANERARCRAHYSRRTSTTYVVNATCATASGRATQTANLRSVGGNSYRGNFYNSEYNVSGTIHVVVHGNRQSVQLTSDAGSASLQLSR